MNIIRSLEQHEIPQLIEVQKRCFTENLCESLSVFENRFSLFGEYFKVAEMQGSIVGYMIAFPYTLGKIPKNNAPFALPFAPFNCFYIHDITLLKMARGQGLAQKLLESAYTSAQTLGFDTLSLVAVGQSGHYWDRMGFSEYQGLTAQQTALLKSNYDEDSRLMIKHV